MTDLLGEIIKAAPTLVDTDLIRWGQVISTGPLLVRFAGDTSDTTIALQADGMALVTGDKVAIIKLGAQWVVVSKLVDPANAFAGGGASWGIGYGQWFPYESGKYYPGYGLSVTAPTNAWTAISEASYPMPIFITRAVTISALVSPNSASVTNDLKWALYDSDNAGYPSNLLDSGEETGTITESMDLTLTADLDLKPGVYWAMFKYSASTTSGFRYSSSFDTSYYSNHLIHMFNHGQTTGVLAAETLSNVQHGIYYWVDTYAAAFPDPWAAPGAWTMNSTANSHGPPVFKVA